VYPQAAWAVMGKRLAHALTNHVALPCWLQYVMLHARREALAGRLATAYKALDKVGRRAIPAAPAVSTAGQASSRLLRPPLLRDATAGADVDSSPFDAAPCIRHRRCC
jgi:hypothetical protein